MNEIVKKQEAEVVAINSPYSLIETAIGQGATAETLEKLMALNERYEANEARKAFFVAMQEFQSVKPELIRKSKVKFNTTDYNFCSLSDIEKALKAPLSDCGLSYRFENGENENKFSVTCIVSHVQGHSERTTMSAPLDDSGNKNSIQGIGSTSTYLMRYTVVAAFALTTADEDNDGATNSDLPFQRVVEQNNQLKNIDTLKAVLSIKEYLADDDLDEVCVYYFAMQEELRNALWVAPTKGGIFTVEERKKLMSNEFIAATKEFFQNKNK